MTWAVTVERDGEKVVTIETNCLSGRDLVPGDHEAIRTAAHHLLSFIGDSVVKDRGPEIIELRAALRAMADAYQRKVRTGLTPEQIAKEPWRCAEYIEAERLCRRPPFKLFGDREQMKQNMLIRLTHAPTCAR